MSIGFLKRFLTLAKLVAILVIAGAVWGYLGHRKGMDEAWRPPDFRPPVRSVRAEITRINALQMQLGRFQREVAPTARVEEKVEQEELISALEKLGEIKSAIVVYPPYEGIVPSIIFEYKNPPAGKEKIRTLRLNQALLDRPHKQVARAEPIPLRYQFIGCERDKDKGYAWFLFDMKCDGTDIQKMRWKLEGLHGAELASATGGDDEGLKTVNNAKIYIGEGVGAEEQPQPAQKDTETVTQPVTPEPPSEPIITTAEPTDNLFEDEDGIFAPTREGAQYLKDNYQKILKETRTQTYRDSSGKPAGIRVVGIKNASVANQFGLLKDDVILSVNGRPVTKQAEAVNIVKAELKRNVTIIRVKILRRGRELEKRYDTRDPDTRRLAKRLR